MEKERNKLIGFSKPSMLMVFPLLIPVCCCFRNYFLISLNNIYNDSNHNFNMSKHPLMLGFTSVFSDVLTGGIGYALHSYLTNLKEKRLQNELCAERFSTNHIETIKFKSKPWYYEPKCIGLLLMNSVLECVFLTSFIIFGKNMDGTIQCYQMNIVLILLEALMSYRFLKIPIYRHRIVSIAVIIIGIICICIEKSSSILNYNTLFALGVYCMISMLDISQKWIMSKRYVFPYKLLFIQGIISSSMFIIAFGLFYAIPCPTEVICYEGRQIEEIFNTFYTFFTSKDAYSAQAIGYYFCYYLTCGFYVVFVFSTIGFFSPTLRCMSDTLGTFTFWIISFLIYSEPFYIFTFIMNILIILSYLIYNEIIILYFWGLSTNTSKEIDNRAKEDHRISLMIMPKEGEPEEEHPDAIVEKYD